MTRRNFKDWKVEWMTRKQLKRQAKTPLNKAASSEYVRRYGISCPVFSKSK